MQRQPRTPGARGTRGIVGRALPPSSHLRRALRALPYVAIAACTGPERSTEADPSRAPITAPVTTAAPTASLAAAPLGALATAGQTSFPITNPGRWSGLIAWDHVAVHMTLLPNGEVLTWPGGDHEGKGDRPSQAATVWDPASGARDSVPNLRTNIFCSGHTLLPDGRVFVAGGHFEQYDGARDVNVFNYRRARWSRGSDMNAGRWYPTALTLANGDVLVVGGTTETGVQNMTPQVWSPIFGWRSLTGAQAAVPYYPWLYVAPNGKVFYAGPSTAQTGYLATNGAGAWQLSAGAFPSSATTEGEGSEREYGSSVMLDGVVLRMGGGGWSNKSLAPVGPPITNTAERIDLNVAAPAWTPIAPMAHARRHMTAVALPDGKVFVVGGTSQHGGNIAGSFSAAVRVPELYDQATNTWTPGATMAKARLYHSTAMLLPDARVLVAGGGLPAPPGGSSNLDAQIYSPPYLFLSTGAARRRPEVGNAPTVATYRQSFPVSVTYPDGTTPTISLVTLVRIGSVTHTYNSTQRVVTLAAVQSGNSVSVTMPASPNLAPPGHYLLFALNEIGTPSVGRIVQIR